MQYTITQTRTLVSQQTLTEDQMKDLLAQANLTLDDLEGDEYMTHLAIMRALEAGDPTSDEAYTYDWLEHTDVFIADHNLAVTRKD